MPSLRRAALTLAAVGALAATVLGGGSAAQATTATAWISPTSGPLGTVITVNGTGWNDVGPGYTDTVCVFMQAEGQPAYSPGTTCSQQPGGHIVQVAADGTFTTTITAVDVGSATADVWVMYYSVPLDAFGNFGVGPRFDITGLTPAMPTQLTVRGTPRAFILMWRDNSRNETGFIVTNGVEDRQVGANRTTYVWSSMPGTYMCFEVAAVNKYGSSGWFPNYAPWYVCVTTPQPGR